MSPIKDMCINFTELYQHLVMY